MSDLNSWFLHSRILLIERLVLLIERLIFLVERMVHLFIQPGKSVVSY